MQLNEVYFLFWLGLSVSFIPASAFSFKLPLPHRMLPDFSPSAHIILFLISAVVLLHFLLHFGFSKSLFIYVLSSLLYRSTVKPFSSPLLLHL